MNNSQTRILLVEDEVELSDILRDYLRAEGFEVSTEYRGDGVVERAKQINPDLILLDRNLPGTDGLDICRQLRTFSNVAIIMLTARVDEIDRLMGLDSGADDYVCKPVTPKEVIARVKAVLRRFHHLDTASSPSKVTLDDDCLQAFWEGNNLGLTPVEFRLLKMFLRSSQGMGSRASLMNAAYEDGRRVSDRTIDSHVKNLRAKLIASSHIENPIRSIYGVGYQLCLEPSTPNHQ